MIVRRLRSEMRRIRLLGFLAGGGSSSLVSPSNIINSESKKA